MTGKELTALMRKHKVTMKQLSTRMGITQKRIREVRVEGLSDANTIRDWIEAVTGKDPAPSELCDRGAAIVASIRELASGTLASLTGESDYDKLDVIRAEFLRHAEGRCRSFRGELSWECWQDAWNSFVTDRPEYAKATAHDKVPVRIYTTAPEAYDGFSTRTVDAEAGRDGDKVVRLVEMAERDVEWQTGRYASGLHCALRQHEWMQLVQAGVMTAGRCETVTITCKTPEEIVADEVLAKEQTQIGPAVPMPAASRVTASPVTDDEHKVAGESQEAATAQPAAEQASAETPPVDTPAIDTRAPKLRPVLLLPANLAPLAKLAAKENLRYAMAGVRVESTEGGYRCAATDGKVLGVVTGEPDDASEFPEVNGVQSAVATATEVVVPVKPWADAFKSLPKRRVAKPILGNVATVLGTDKTVLATTDLDSPSVSEPRNLDGRYPDFASAFPKGKPTVAFRVDARLFARLLEVAGQFSADDTADVTVEVYGADVPVVVRARRIGQAFDGAIMPLK